MSTVIPTTDHDIGALVPLDQDNPPKEVKADKAERVKKFPKLIDFINDLCRTIEQQDKQERIGILTSQVRCTAYYDGRQFGKVSDSGEWEDSPSALEPESITPRDNIFKVQVDKLNMEMCRAFVDLEVTANDQTDSAKVEAQDVAKKRLKVIRDRLNTAKFIQDENMSLLLKTITYRYSWFDKQQGAEQKSPEYGEESREGSAVEVCSMCGKPKDSMDEPETEGSSPVCGHCQSTRFEKMQSPGTTKQVIKGYETRSAGKVCTIHVDPLSVTLQLSARDIPSSKYLWWRQMVDRCVLEEAYPDRKIPSGKHNEDYDGYQSTPQNHPSNAFGDSGIQDAKGGEQFEKIPYDLVWIDRIVYANYVSGQDEKLPDGRTLPKFTKLGTMCETGMCVAKVHTTVLDYYDEDKNKKWTMCVYGAREHALHGSGTNAALDNQDTHNNFNAYIQYNAFTNSAPREFVVADRIEGGNLPTIGTVGIVNNMPENQGLPGAVYGKSEGSTLAADVYGVRESNLGSIQEQAGTSSLLTTGTSAQDAALGTATGIAAMRDQAVGRMGPNLMLKSSMEEEHAYQVLELEQASIPEEEWKKLSKVGLVSQGNIGYSEEGIRAFLESNIREDFTIKAVPGSWMPQTDTQERADFQAYATIAGQLLGVPPTPETQELLAQAAKVFGQPLQNQDWDANEREAARRLRLLAVVVEKMERNLPDTRSAPPEVLQALAVEVLKLAPGAAMNPEMDDHVAFNEFYNDWFSSDEGVKASPLLRKVVETRHIEHRTGVVYQVGEQKADEVKATAPAQAIMQGAQDEQEAKMKEEMAAQQAAAKEESDKQETIQAAQYAFDKNEAEEKMTHDAEEKAKQRQFDASEKDKDRELQIQMKVLDGMAQESAAEDAADAKDRDKEKK